MMKSTSINFVDATKKVLVFSRDADGLYEQEGEITEGQTKVSNFHSIVFSFQLLLKNLHSFIPPKNLKFEQQGCYCIDCFQNK